MPHNMLPPGLSPSTTTIANGRSYTAALGSVLPVVNDADSDKLESAGWIRAAQLGSGTTAQRPRMTSYPRGARAEYLDTTLGIIVVWDGAAWRNPLTGAAV